MHISTSTSSRFAALLAVLTVSGIVFLFVQASPIHGYKRFSHGLLSTTLRHIAVNDLSLQVSRDASDSLSKFC